VTWVDDNIDNILNYENNILVSKAEDKLLFLAFCMEFKRFYEFYNNENLMEFHTYLPIQLDATCNGFQHMALLSDEDTLFKELNIETTKENNISNRYDENPRDFYTFMLHKLYKLLADNVNNGIQDDSKGGSYSRLYDFIWNRKVIKKAIMTIPYNASARARKRYLIDSLTMVNRDDENMKWYSDSESNSKNAINTDDIYLLLRCVSYIVENDFPKIHKLCKYLSNVAKILSMLELPITWTLPTGLTVKQSYLETRSTTITPFMYSKVKLTLSVTVKDKLDKNRQVRSLMPNLIHSLDATSLNMLYQQFKKAYEYKESNILPQFFSVHDCFGTTCDKVSTLKTILASVYTELYSSKPYLIKFDNYIFENIENNTSYPVDRINRTVEVSDSTKYKIHDIKWVLNEKQVSNKEIRNIDSQHIIL